MTETGLLQPTGVLVLDALQRRLLQLAPDLQARGPRGGWTAYYRGHDVIVLARVPSGSPTAIDVASPGTGWAARLRSSADLDDPSVTEGLVRSVEQARQLRPATAGEFGPPPLAAVASVLVLLDLAGSIIAGVKQLRQARRDPANLDTIVAAASIEERRRESSLSLGCFAAVGISIGALVAGFGLAALLNLNPAVTGAVDTMALVGALVAGLAAMWAIRRRYPSPPQTRMDRLGGRLVLLIVVLAAALAVYEIARGPDPLRPEQARWCLEEGAGYVDNAVRVLSIDVTWTATSAADDPNFRRACSTAWTATHP